MNDFVEDCDYEVVLAQPVDYKDRKKCHYNQQNILKWKVAGKNQAIETLYRNPYVLLNLWLMCNETLYLKFIGLV